MMMMLLQAGVLRFLLWNLSIICPRICVSKSLTRWGPDKHAMPPFLKASSAEPSVYICVQSVCGYFSSISRVRAICCAGICCSAGNRPGTSKETVASRSARLPLCWRGFPHSSADTGFLPLFSWDLWPNGWGAVSSICFWLVLPACCGADDQVVFGSSTSG